MACPSFYSFQSAAAVFISIFGFSFASYANDSSAILDANGIRLIETQDISLEVEDLYISPSDIRIHYEFFNHSDQAKRMLVAFPVPEIEAEPEYNYGLNYSDPINFLGFAVNANGQPIKPGLEIKLTMNGVDFTNDLISNGVPLHRFAPDYYEKLETLSDANKQALAEKGLIDWRPGEAFYNKNWKVKATYYWWQDFAANSMTVIDHSYHPITGGGIFDEEYGIKYTAERFCIDDGFRKAFRKKAEQSEQSTMLSYETRYILRTANNWMGPIGKFRLVIDKLSPDNLVSLCIHGIRKIAPTQFEFRADNFVPDQDLDILVVAPPG